MYEQSEVTKMFAQHTMDENITIALSSPLLYIIVNHCTQFLVVSHSTIDDQCLV